MSSKKTSQKRKQPTGSGDGAKRPKHDQGEEDFTWTPSQVLAFEHDVPVNTASKVIKLLEEFSVPFIARYRQNMTGGMGPEKLRALQDHYEELVEVRQKATKLIKAANKEGDKSSKALPANFFRDVLSATTAEELDLAKEAAGLTGTKAKSKAALAVMAGLEPLAKNILDNTGDINLDNWIDRSVECRRTRAAVRESTEAILREVVARHPEVKKAALEAAAEPRHAVKINCRKINSRKKDANKDEAVYKHYFEFSCPVKFVKPHQTLAINRGEKNKVLSVSLTHHASLKFEVVRFCRRKFDVNQGGLRDQMMQDAIQTGFDNSIFPFVSRRLRRSLTLTAEAAALAAFCGNLHSLLLQPPVRPTGPVVGIDPGFRNGCKVGCIDAAGKVVDTGVIHPIFAKSALSPRDKEWFSNLVRSNGVKRLALGNGTACRETELVLAKLIKSGDLGDEVEYAIVSEQGASIYSCSEEALKAHPGLDPNVISAVSIARRLQDPLSEYVKVDPQHLGVGMYQHDLSQAKLRKNTEQVLQECVSFVGVDLNYVPAHVLSRVSGLNSAVASAIVKRREEVGPFNNRAQLKDVKGLGPVKFTQAAGFVRIFNDNSSASYNPLDSLLIHPESYSLAKRILQAEGQKTKHIGQAKLTDHFKHLLADKDKMNCLKQKLSVDDEYTVDQIVKAFSEELRHDLRLEKQSGALFRRDVRSLDSLTVGDALTGRVTNVVPFGAFVDVGVGADGLVHSSNMIQGRDPPWLGEKVEVRVISLEPKRIGLKLLKIL